MSISGTNAASETFDDRTLEELPVAALDTPEPTVAPVELVHGPPRELADETQEVLLQRLRVGSLVMFSGFLFYTLRAAYFLPSADAPRIGESNAVTTYRAAATVVLAICAAYLWSPIRLSLVTLRFLELGVFGASTGICVLIESQLISQALHPEHPAVVQSAVAASIVMWFALALIYGVFIPNTWWRAAIVLGVILAIPFVMMLVASVNSREFGRVALIDSLLPASGVMLVGYATAVYSSYTMGRLRREVFVARQLGQYRLGQLLGSGGMGEVYLAEHQMLKRPCAIKTIRAARANDARALARFEREVRATAQLSHWNIVEIFDYGCSEDGTFFYVMEYLPGLSLQQIVEQQGAVQPARAVHLIRQICQGLAEAHRLGLVHRDIKPSNIIATARGGAYDVAKLLDFGLAATAAEVAPNGRPGQVAGSPHYMAPEVIRGAIPDIRSDLYSLGGVLYFLLAGRPAYRGTDPVAVMRAQVEDPLPALESVCPQVPADLAAVVRRCLAKDPRERYADARELDLALATCQCATGWTQELAVRWWVARGRRPDGSLATPPLDG
ncbi:MAG: serine/threonine protein kinase [Pirellulales bacterium]|nr:serine/threonine protein kinase [Pirellulales bacterium]